MTACRIRIFARRALLAVLLGAVAPVHAAISLSTTRVIFDSASKEASLIVRNGDAQNEALVQSWIESNTPGDEGDLPFAMTPPVAKMAAQGQQLLRILYAGGGNAMPADKESVLWLNVQEIPQAFSEDNSLQLAVRQRIKLFFRPQGLPGRASDAPYDLSWKMVQNQGETVLHVVNPTAYHVSTSTIDIQVDGESMQLAKSRMIAPEEAIAFALPMNAKHALIKFTAINDFGGSEDYQVTLDLEKPGEADRIH